jgi:hypothetical protein
LPVDFAAVSSRLMPLLPSSVNRLGSLSFTSLGGVCLAAFAASWPYESFLPLLWSTMPFSVLHSAGSTFHVSAAAPISIARAAAPALRIGSQCPRTEVEPPVACMPKIGFANA